MRHAARRAAVLGLGLASPVWAAAGEHQSGWLELVMLGVVAMALGDLLKRIGRAVGLEPTPPEPPTRTPLEGRLAAIEQRLGRLEALAGVAATDEAGRRDGPSLTVARPVTANQQALRAAGEAGGSQPATALERVCSQSGLKGDAGRLQQTLNYLAEVPKQLSTALDGPDAVAAISRWRLALDRALYEPLSADELWQGLGGQMPALTAADSEALAQWAASERAAWLAALEGKGLRRIAPAAGHPFNPDLVVPSDEPAAPTQNPDWDGRVAHVRPGDGGYKWQGQVVCQARAQRYEYRGQTQSGADSRTG